MAARLPAECDADLGDDLEIAALCRGAFFTQSVAEPRISRVNITNL